jgi:hypothetical protein
LPALVTAAAAVLPPRRSEPVIVPEDAVPEPPNPVPANLQLLMAAAARAQARQAEPASPPRPPRMVEPEMVPAAPVMAELPPARPILPEARMRMPAPPAPPPLEEPPAIMVPRPRRLPEPMPPEPVERPILPDAGRLPTRPTDLPPATPVPAPVEPEPIVRETARPEETRREENRAEEIRGLMPPSPPEPDEEVELAWYGYAARTLLPSFLVLTAITVVVGPGAWFLEPVAWVWAHIDPLWLAAPLGAAWLLQLVRWGYRVGCYSYRLTNRRLFVSQGFLYPRRDGLDLADIARTRSSKTLMGWLLNVGRVHVELADPQSEPVILEGVSGPRRVANQLLQRAQEAREASVVSGRWTAPTR